MLACAFALLASSGCIPPVPVQQPAPVSTAADPQSNPSTAAPSSNTPSAAAGEEAARQLAAQYPCIPPGQKGEWAQVLEVIDGDTITVAIDGLTYRVRYLGINAPEMDEPAGPDAKSCNLALLAGQQVYLLKDASETDRYERLLRFVFTTSSFVNHDLIASGCALQVEYAPDVACTALFQEAQEKAKAEGLGLWGAAVADGSPAAGVQIRTVFYDGVQGQNEPDEYVEFENTGDQPVELGNWYLRDKGSHRFDFPSFQLSPGQVCRVYTNEQHPEHCGFSFGVSASAVWNNGGDCAYLYTGGGDLVAEYCY